MQFQLHYERHVAVFPKIYTVLNLVNAEPTVVFVQNRKLKKKKKKTDQNVCA